MSPCPHCGVLLDARLVAAIKNPSMEESCPRRESKPAESVAPVAANRLATYMFAAHLMREGLSK